MYGIFTWQQAARDHVKAEPGFNVNNVLKTKKLSQWHIQKKKTKRKLGKTEDSERTQWIKLYALFPSKVGALVLP